MWISRVKYHEMVAALVREVAFGTARAESNESLKRRVAELQEKHDKLQREYIDFIQEYAHSSVEQAGKVDNVGRWAEQLKPAEDDDELTEVELPEGAMTADSLRQTFDRMHGAGESIDEAKEAGAYFAKPMKYVPLGEEQETAD